MLIKIYSYKHLANKAEMRGNHLSHTTCPTHAFFKSDESRSKFNKRVDIRLAMPQKTNVAGLDKWR